MPMNICQEICKNFRAAEIQNKAFVTLILRYRLHVVGNEFELIISEIYDMINKKEIFYEQIG